MPFFKYVVNFIYFSILIDATIKIWDTNERKIKLTINETSSVNKNCLWANSDIGYLVSGTNDIKVWDINDFITR